MGEALFYIAWMACAVVIACMAFKLGSDFTVLGGAASFGCGVIALRGVQKQRSRR